jgi:hypothetical protein
MKRAINYIAVFGLCLFLVSVSFAADEEFSVPVEFKSTDMKDIGNFHGAAPANEQAGWNYWGGREPIVSPGWVVFPVTGSYQFVIECKSQQFDPGDADKGIWAEFDVRLHVLDGKNNAGNIKDLIEVVGDTGGDWVVAHGASTTDDRIGEDWAKTTVAMMDPITEEPIEIEAGTLAQLEIWFTNDEWDDPKDRNIMVRTVAVLFPEGFKLAVEPADKLTTTWGKMKAE